MIRRVVAGVGANIFDKLIVAGSQLVLIPLLSSAWGLHLYGLWVLLATVPSFLAMSDLGFATAAGTKMTMAYAKGDKQEVVHIFQSAWIAILASSAVLFLVALTFAWSIPQFLFGDDPGLPVHDLRLTLSLLLLYGIVAVQGSIFSAGFRAARLFAVGASWNALIILIESLGLITAVLAGADLPWAAGTLLIGRLVGLLGQNILLRMCVPWLRIGVSECTYPEIRALLRPAVAVMLLPIAQALALQGTTLALGAAAGQTAVPVFTAVRTLSRVGLQMCWLFNTPLMPEFSAAAARKDRPVMAAIALTTLLFSTLLVLPFAVVFGIFGKRAILLWTHGVIDSPAALVTIMAVAMLLGGYWYPLSNLILARNLHGQYTRWYAVLALLSIPLAWCLSHVYGACGAAAAMAALDGLMLFLIVKLTGRTVVSWYEIRAAFPAALRFIGRAGDYMVGATRGKT